MAVQVVVAVSVLTVVLIGPHTCPQVLVFVFLGDGEVNRGLG